jgi:hypothetical protein
MLGCSKEVIFDFQKDEVQSLSVYTYDFGIEETTNNWVYKEEDMEEFLSYLKNLTGIKKDSIELEKLSGLFYGVELNIADPFHVLFAGDYAITHDGEFYLIDGEEAERMCQLIIGDTRVYDNVFYIMNHRYLSLVDGDWDTRFIAKSRWTSKPLENAKMNGAITLLDVENEVMDFTITNNTGGILEFGSRLELETKVGEVWYSIDDLINDNVNLAWTEELYRLDSSNVIDGKYYFKYYQPLPKGKYRIVKEVKVDDKVGHLRYEFEVK